MYLQNLPPQFRSCVTAQDRLGQVTGIRLSRRSLSAVPDWLEKLTALIELDLAHNQLSHLPETIGRLRGLKRLDLSYNRLTYFPEPVGRLTALTELDLAHNQLSHLPETIGQLTALTELDLAGNQLSHLPETIGRLRALKRLDLSYNRLGHQRLSYLPETIGGLTVLTELDLSDNSLHSLPESIGGLIALSKLNVSGNELTFLPESIWTLNALNSLDLNYNRLPLLSESVGRLTALTELNLTGNKLTGLPRQLADCLTNGLYLRIGNNPLDDPLPEIVARGADALATYLASLDDSITQYEAKLLVVGEGTVGKTSLVAALRGAPFIEGRPTTHGIEIWPLTFRHPDIDRDMTLHAWDFGGQDVYRVTHQFFFSRRALYVVVWNARKGQEQDEVEGWLRRIRLRVGHDARMMVVATHCEERLPELDYVQLEHEFPDMLAGSFEVDNSSGVGIPELREAIARVAAQLPPMGQRINPRWAAARDQILDRAQAEPQIQYEQFADVCKRHEITGSEIVTLAQLMHDLGHIIYYGEDEGLKDIVVLNPEWLTMAISYVLEDSPTKRAGGILDHARLKEIWQKREDGPSYPARFHPYFLRLMEKFDVSYRLEDDELHSLVAQLVPYERPALPWRARTQPPAGIRTLALVCRLAEPAPGLIPWLTVRHHRASTGLYWRHGVFLRHPIAAYESEALLELNHFTDLALEVRAPSPDLYFNVLRDSIEDLITRRWPGLAYELFIPCPGKASRGSMCQGQFPLYGLMRLREHGLTSYPCIECAKEYEISLLLTGFAVPAQLLSAELDEIHDQLNRIESHAAETAESVRRVLRVVSGRGYRLPPSIYPRQGKPAEASAHISIPLPSHIVVRAFGILASVGSGEL